MALSCVCPDYDEYEVGGWYYYPPAEYSTMPLAPRRKRCCSCHSLIEPGAVVQKYDRNRHPCNEIEERLRGDEIPLAPWYHCEKCADLYLSLKDLGFCVELADSMPDLLEQYHMFYLPMKAKEL